MIPIRLNLVVAFTRLLQHGQEFRELGKFAGPISADYVGAYELFREDAKALGLLSCFDQTERIIQRFRDGPAISPSEYAEMLQALLDRFLDETARHQYFMLPYHKLYFYSEARVIFGEHVNKSFQSAQKDIECAAKCYAFGTNTAAVFHLMRVVEVGLRALGKSLNEPSLDPKRNPTWETILRRCDDELRKPLKDRSQEWSTDGQFYSDATANLRAVKDAWRNSTMHVERDYDEDEALSVFNAVKGFMQKLAERLSE
jgi:hypothetical protein